MDVYILWLNKCNLQQKTGTALTTPQNFENNSDPINDSIKKAANAALFTILFSDQLRQMLQ